MGIEKFFSTLNKNFNIIDTIDMDNLEEASDPISAKYLFIDFNSIIHQTSSKLISELNSNKNIDSQNKKLKLDDIEIMIIDRVNRFIITLLERINLESLDLIYIAIDGVPTFGKILEQKKRRFIGDFVEKLLSKYSLDINWSKNNISPGTLFMNKITNFLQNIQEVSKNKTVNKDQENYEFYTRVNKIQFSDSNKEGEGEMKILDEINNISNNNKILFFSPDSDVILLSMLSKNSNNIDVLRFSVEEQKNILSIIDILLLKETIFNYCQYRIGDTNFMNLRINNLIQDIVFIFTIFGNDFLPRCEAIQTNLDFLFLIDMYLINLIDSGYIINVSSINGQSFYNYLTLLEKNEKRLLFRNAYQNIFQNYNYANQTNFIIDLLNLRDLKPVKFGKKFGEPFYNFYNNIIHYIDPSKISEFIAKNRYGCLNFYQLSVDKVIDIVRNSLKVTLPINALVTIDVNIITRQTSYEKLIKMKFNSNIKKHVLNMKELTPRDRELYLINNKLDRYYSLFNPISDFYVNIMNHRKVDTNYYYKKYFNDIDSNEKEVVNQYLSGFNWIFQYYFNRFSPNKIIDELWYYKYHKAPLFVSMIKYFSPNYINKSFVKNKKIDITPLEQLLYITPIRISDLSKPEFYTLFTHDKELMKKIRLFVETNIELFFNLDEIYYSVSTGNLKKDLFDCSQSSFIAKCHYEILNYIVNINEFIIKLRKFI